MKRKIRALLLAFFCLTICLMLLVACVDKPDENTTGNDGTSNSQPKVDVELDRFNYANYLDVQYYMVSQTSTVKYNTYVVTYATGIVGRTYIEYVNALTPPTGSNVIKCVYLSSRYTIQTTISVNIKTKSSDYNFSDAYLLFRYIPTPGSSLSIKVELDNNGNGSRIFNMVEESGKTYINYSSMPLEVNGTVSCYEAAN